MTPTRARRSALTSIAALLLAFGCAPSTVTLPDLSLDDGGVPPDAITPEDLGSDTGPGDAGADAPLVTLVEPASVARESGFSVTGARLSGATMLQIGGVPQVIAMATETSITVDAVAASTPLGDQDVVVTTPDGTSAPVTVTVLGPLSVVAAVATDPTSVTLTFDRALDATSVDAGDFSSADLTLDAASVSGATVTLTTSTQTSGVSYTIEVSDVVDTFGHGLTESSATSAVFVGYSPLIPQITTVTPATAVIGHSSLTIGGVNLLGPTVTVGGVEQTLTSAATDSIVTGPLAATTPTGTQPVQVSTASGTSSTFDIEVLEPFELTGATATSATQVVVTANRAPDPSTVDPARFTIPSLAVTGASASGATITLTTAEQTPSASYSVGADTGLLDMNGAPATSDFETFTGFVPPVPTDFVVVRVGDGSAPLDTTGFPVFLERRAIADGSVDATAALPATASGTNRAFLLAGDDEFNGGLTRSVDGTQLVLAGYQPGTNADIDGTPGTEPRVVAFVDAADFGASPAVDTSLTLDTAFGSTKVWQVATDGANVWAGGGFGNIRMVPVAGGSAVQINAGGPSNGRAVRIFDGQLYYASTNPGVAGVHAVGTGLPTTAGTATSLFLDVASAGDFVLFDLDATEPGPDVAYVAVQGTGMQRYTKSGGVWSTPTTFPPAVQRAACFVVAGDVTCIAGDESTLYTFTDPGAAGASATMTSIATAATNTEFRGVALSPTP